MNNEQIVKSALVTGVATGAAAGAAGLIYDKKPSEALARGAKVAAIMAVYEATNLWVEKVNAEYAFRQELDTLVVKSDVNNNHPRRQTMDFRDPRVIRSAKNILAYCRFLCEMSVVPADEEAGLLAMAFGRLGAPVTTSVIEAFVHVDSQEWADGFENKKTAFTLLDTFRIMGAVPLDKRSKDWCSTATSAIKLGIDLIANSPSHLHNFGPTTSIDNMDIWPPVELFEATCALARAKFDTEAKANTEPSEPQYQASSTRLPGFDSEQDSEQERSVQLFIVGALVCGIFGAIIVMFH